MKDQTNEIISQTLCLDSIQIYCLIKMKKETDLSYEGVEMVEAAQLLGKVHGGGDNRET